MRPVKPSTLFLSFYLGLSSTAAMAALKPGDTAPDFTVQAAQGGKEFKFSLAEALKKGQWFFTFIPNHSPAFARSRRMNSPKTSRISQLLARPSLAFQATK
jgi:hypothetical protein